MASKKSTPIFEHIPCKRCGGSGEYSYCPRFGRTCFRCNGSGNELTKRGAAAQKFYHDMFTVKGSELVPGNLIWGMGVTLGGDLYHRWMRVISNDPEAMVMVLMDGKEEMTLHYDSGSTYRKAPKTQEDKAAAIKLALDYQATLTQAGTVRKIRGAK